MIHSVLFTRFIHTCHFGTHFDISNRTGPATLIISIPNNSKFKRTISPYNANKDGKNFALKKKTDICVSWDSLARLFGMDL